MWNNPTYHVVSNLVLDAQFSDNERISSLQDRLSYWSKYTLPDELERAFNQYCPHDKTWIIPALELDLGEINYSDLEKELAVKFREAINNYFNNLLVHHAGNSARVIEVRDTSLAGLEVLQFYFQNGYMPWNYKATMGDVNQLTETLLWERKAAFVEMVRAVGSNSEVVRKRIAWQVKEPLIVKMVSVLEPGNGVQIVQFSEEMVRLQSQSRMVASSNSEFKKNIWFWILNYLLSERGTLFNRIAFVKSNIRHMADRYNLAYTDMVKLINEAIIKVSSQVVIKAEFIKTLQLIAAQEGLSGESTLLVERDSVTEEDLLFQNPAKLWDKGDEIFIRVLSEKVDKVVGIDAGRIFKKAQFNSTEWRSFIEKSNEAVFYRILEVLNPKLNTECKEFVLFMDGLKQFGWTTNEKKVFRELLLNYAALLCYKEFPVSVFVRQWFSVFTKAKLNNKVGLWAQLAEFDFSKSPRFPLSNLLLKEVITQLNRPNCRFNNKGSNYLFGELHHSLKTISNKATLSEKETKQIKWLVEICFKIDRKKSQAVFALNLKLLLNSTVLNRIIGVKHWQQLLLGINTIHTQVLNELIEDWELYSRNNSCVYPGAIGKEWFGLSAFIISVKNNNSSAEEFRRLVLEKIVNTVPLEGIDFISSSDKYKKYRQLLLNQLPVYNLKLNYASKLFASHGNSLMPLLFKLYSSNRKLVFYSIQRKNGYLADWFLKLTVENKLELIEFVFPGFTKSNKVYITRLFVWFSQSEYKLSVESITKIWIESIVSLIVKNRFIISSLKDLYTNSLQQVAFEFNFNYNSLLEFVFNLKKYKPNVVLIPSNSFSYALSGYNRDLISLFKISLRQKSEEILFKGKISNKLVVIEDVVFNRPYLLWVAIQKKELTVKEFNSLFSFIKEEEFCLQLALVSNNSGLFRDLASFIKLSRKLFESSNSGWLNKKIEHFFSKCIFNNKFSVNSLQAFINELLLESVTQLGYSSAALASGIVNSNLVNAPSIQKLIIKVFPECELLGTNNGLDFYVAEWLNKLAEKGLLESVCLSVFKQGVLPHWWLKDSGTRISILQLKTGAITYYPEVVKHVFRKELVYNGSYLGDISNEDLKLIEQYSLVSYNSKAGIIESFFRLISLVPNIAPIGFMYKELRYQLVRLYIEAWVYGRWQLISPAAIWSKVKWVIVYRNNINLKDYQVHFKKLYTLLPPTTRLAYKEIILETNKETNPAGLLPVRLLKTQVKSKNAAGSLPVSIPVFNAGLVLLSAYIPILFNRLGLTKEDRFVTEEARENAVLLLQYLVTGKVEIEEQYLVLNKVLCGMELEFPVSSYLNLVEVYKTTIEGLIKAAIGYWPVIGSCSVDGFRGNWLVRNGLLTEKEDRWELEIEKKVYDMLIHKSPFSFSIIRFPWMKKPLYVNWPY